MANVSTFPRVSIIFDDFDDDDNDDDDDDDDDDNLFLWNCCSMKNVTPYFQPRPLPEILTVASLLQAVSGI